MDTNTVILDRGTYDNLLQKYNKETILIEKARDKFNAEVAEYDKGLIKVIARDKFMNHEFISKIDFIKLLVDSYQGEIDELLKELLIYNKKVVEYEKKVNNYEHVYKEDQIKLNYFETNSRLDAISIQQLKKLSIRKFLKWRKE